MIENIKRLWGEHPIMLSAFLVASAVTLFFAIRLLAFTIYWSNPAHHNVQVQSWMTTGYIARSWRLDPREIDEVAGLPKPAGHPFPLAEIAKDRGVPVAEIIKQVEDAIAVLLVEKALK